MARPAPGRVRLHRGGQRELYQGLQKSNGGGTMKEFIELVRQMRKVTIKTKHYEIQSKKAHLRDKD